MIWVPVHATPWIFSSGSSTSTGDPIVSFGSNKERITGFERVTESDRDMESVKDLVAALARVILSEIDRESDNNAIAPDVFDRVTESNNDMESVSDRVAAFNLVTASVTDRESDNDTV